VGLKFVHAADLHLGASLSGLKDLPAGLAVRLMQAPKRAFVNLIDICLTAQIQFLILAGDVFETNRPSLHMQKLFYDQLQRLNQQNIEVFMVTGNHDAQLFQNMVFSMPDNLHVFPCDTVCSYQRQYDKHPVMISGISYKHVEMPDVSELFPNNTEGNLHIGVLHCEVGGGAASPYAPVALEKLVAKHYTYWALGHVHNLQSWQNPGLIQYSGVLQGRHILETGVKGCQLVTVADDGSVSSELIPCCDIIWENTTVDLTATTPDTLETKLHAVKEQHRQTSAQGTLLEITLTGATPCYEWLQQEHQIEELIQALRYGEEETAPNLVWITQIINKTAPEIDWDAIYQRGDFLSDVLQAIDQLVENPLEVAKIDATIAGIIGQYNLDIDYTQVITQAKLLAYQLLGSERR